MNSAITFDALSSERAITGKAPIWDHRRNCLWWADIQAQRLLASRHDGTTTIYYTPGQPGLIAIAESGRLCVGLEDGLWLFDPERTQWHLLAPVEQDRPTVRLNDGKVDTHGNLWFGSMDMTNTGQRIGRLYRRDRAGTVKALRENVGTPNAIVPTADGSGLWFVDSAVRTLQFISTDGNGDITNVADIIRLPPELAPDGGCADTEGNLWIATVGRGAVLRISRDGDVLEELDLPVTRATMTAFGAEVMTTLYVTTQRRYLTPHQLADQPEAGVVLQAKTTSTGVIPPDLPEC